MAKILGFEEAHVKTYVEKIDSSSIEILSKDRIKNRMVDIDFKNKNDLPVSNEDQSKFFVFFNVGQYYLDDTDKSVLNAALTMLRNLGNKNVYMSGHADSTSSNEFNFTLSELRLKNVRDYIISKGISEESITFKAYGDELPLGDNRTAIGKHMNRRVEITFH